MKHYIDVPMAEMEAGYFTKPQPIACKFCGSTDIMKYGIRNGVQNYICRKCRRRFIAKDAPYNMMTPTEQIGAALKMFCDGLISPGPARLQSSVSLSAIARHLAESYNNPVNPSTVYRWVLRYTSEALRSKTPAEVAGIKDWTELVKKTGGSAPLSLPEGREMPLVKCLICDTEVRKKPSEVAAASKAGSTCSLACQTELNSLAQRKVNPDRARLVLFLGEGDRPKIAKMLGCGMSAVGRLIRGTDRLSTTMLATCEGCGGKFITRLNWDWPKDAPKHFYHSMECLKG